MKKILIDDRWINTGGIGIFAEEVNKICGYKSAGFSGKPFSPIDSFKTALKSIFIKDSVIFYPGYIPPMFSTVPFVFTIHDLNHLDRPENSSIAKRLFYKFIIKNACRRAKYIFTVSDFSKNRILEWSGVDSGKVINVGNGVSKEFNPDVTGDYYTFDYILCVSNRKSHKNEIRTVQAFSEANLSKDIKLVFTGKPNDEIEKHIKECNLVDRVFFTGYVHEEKLPSLYKGAKALVFVSLYEGFGLPVIEAMASGTPVVTSKTTSLGEVAGDAALQVNPENTIEIAFALNRVILDDDLRQNLVEAGFNQAKKYSWEEVSSKVKSYLDKVI